MKSVLLNLSVLCCLTSLYAQCPFDPTVINGNVSLCPSQSDTLSTQLASSYQWFKNGNPIIGANQQTLVINQIQDAGASFLVASTNNGCTEPSPSIQVNSINVPSINFQVTDSPDNTACTGNEINLRVLPPFDTNIRWFRNGVHISGQFSDTLKALTSGTYSVSGAIAQCPNTLRLSSTTSLNFINADVPVIVENSQLLTLSTTTIAQSYQWYLNNTQLPGATENTFTPTVNGVYKVEAFYSQGCRKESSPYSFNSIVVECPFEVTVSPSDLILCPESEGTLTTIEGDAYQWYRNGEPIQDATQQQYIVDHFNSAGYYFSVDVTIAECTERSSEVLVDGWVFLPVTVTTLSEIPENELCEGDTVYLKLNEPYVNGIIWTRDNLEIENETNDSLLITVGGTYSVAGFTQTCPDFGGVSVPIEITFKPAPIPQISYEEATQVISTNASNVAAYDWFIDGVLSEQFNSSSFGAPLSAEYKLTVEYSNGCSASSEPLVVIVAGINELMSSSIQLMPNPFSDNLQITSLDNNLLNIEMLSSHGTLIHKESFVGQITIDTSDLSSGFYLLRVTKGNYSYNYKLIK
jgi:hypothetical protein